MKTALATLCALLCFASCSRRGAIVVGSKNFTEQIILGEIAAQQLERKLHVGVERRFNLGGTLLTHLAIVKGDIDIYPEYTGTGATVVLKEKTVPSNPADAYRDVKEAYLRKYQLIWLPPLGFNDTFAMVVRSADARKLRIRDLSGAGVRSWRLGIGYEFLTRPDGFASLNRDYRLQWQGTPKSMDLGLLYEALKQQQVDMAAGNSTDAQLSNRDLLMLQDDRKAFPPYNACYIARQPLLQQRPGVRTALTMLGNRISDDDMRRMNRLVDIEHQSIERVARDFLAGEP